MTELEKLRKQHEVACKRVEQAEHQIIRAENRLKSALRKQSKERTHRLIVEGAELEYIFEGIENLPQSNFWEFMRKLNKIPEVIELYSSYKCQANARDEQSQKGGDE
jgi:hypothetical protein